MLIRKRYPGEVLDVRELIQPNSYMVMAAVAPFLYRRDFVGSCYSWVVRNIVYPKGGSAVADWRKQQAFKIDTVVGQSLDFWQFPFETLAMKKGDCEDSAILLCSMLRNRLPHNMVHVTIGTYGGMGHAWVKSGDLIYETTQGLVSPMMESLPYVPMFRFNDVEIINW